MIPRPFLVAAMGLAVALASAADAVSFSFDCITGNSLTDCGIGESQLTVDVLAGPGLLGWRQ